MIDANFRLPYLEEDYSKNPVLGHIAGYSCLFSVPDVLAAVDFSQDVSGCVCAAAEVFLYSDICELHRCLYKQTAAPLYF